MRRGFIIGFAVLTLIGAAIVIRAHRSRQATHGFSADDLRAFASMGPIDAHVHVFKEAPNFNSFLHKLNLHLVDIVYANKDDPTY